MTKISVKQTDVEVPTEVIASAIVEIGAGIKKIRNGRLNDKALVILIHHACQSVSQKDIKAVLGALEDLEKTYIRKKS